MANKRAKQKKPKQKQMGQKGGSMSMTDIGSPTPARKKKK